jgi:acetyl esterase
LTTEVRSVDEIEMAEPDEAGGSEAAGDRARWPRVRGLVGRGALRLALDGAFRAVPEAMRRTPLSRPIANGVAMDRDVEYVPGGGSEQRLDVSRPLGRRPPYAVVLYFHGGGLRFFSKDHYWHVGGLLARKGFLVYNADYRLAPASAYPAAIEDACSAYRFVLADAARRGGDLGRLVVAGDSSGAGLAAAVIAASCYARPEPWARALSALDPLPRLVVLGSGALQITDARRIAGPGAASRLAAEYLSLTTEAFLGDAGARPRPETMLADPLLIFEGSDLPRRPLPAFYALAGTADPVADDTRRLHAALRRLGVASEARFYEGARHAFHLSLWGTQARRAWRELFDHLRERRLIE